MKETSGQALIKEKFDIVVDLGDLILRNGGELFRAQETMERVAAYYELGSFTTYLLADGIFASAALGEENYLAQIRTAPIQDIELSRVEAANALSRSIIKGQCSNEEVCNQIKEIAASRGAGDWQKIFMSGIGSACFCYLFGGTVGDCLGAAIVGTLMYLVMVKVLSPLGFPRMMTTIASSLVAAGACATLFLAGIGTDLDTMTIGSVFALMPGVAFSNGIRNLLENNYLTGIVKLEDAAITAVCIALGVGIVMALRQALGVL